MLSTTVGQFSSADKPLPPKIWDHICSFLPKPSLSRLRLVSSAFNRIALRWAYRDLRLEGFGDSAQRFVEIAKSPQLRDLVREVTIDTSVGLEFTYRGNDRYPSPDSFMDALPYVRCFGNLTALHIRFNEFCGEDDRNGLSIEETWPVRYRVLDTVCHCVAGMWTANQQSEIDEKLEDELYDYEPEYHDPQDDIGVPFDQVIHLKELTIANLADYHDTDLAASTAWRKVISLPSLTDLKLLMATETDEGSDESAAYYEEKYEFYEHLPETWLSPCISDNLRVLSLYSQGYWGWFPKMDFRGIEFPQLRVLALGHYVFSHEWQIDWFASIGQKNGSGVLEELYLDDCPILFKARQTIPLDSSDPGYPVVSTVMDQGTTKMHGYSMRWHDVLSRWATDMKALRVFRMGHGEWDGAPQDTLESIDRDLLYEGVDEKVIRYRISHNTHRSFACPEPVDRAYGVEDPEQAWASGKYLQGTGINGRGGCRMQYIKYDIQVNPSPWQETFRSCMDDDDGYEPEEGTRAKDNAAFEELTLAIQSRMTREETGSEE
ncbi:hypothetical protein EDB80DRAFT_717881 [Ilyonectria destructans]|nr:hypothetical protein EDB80DRAFT_717881 [Ilyonectria destructans]